VHYESGTAQRSLGEKKNDTRVRLSLNGLGKDRIVDGTTVNRKGGRFLISPE